MSSRKPQKPKRLGRPLKAESEKTTPLPPWLIDSPEGEVKMSVLLHQFIEPYSEKWKTAEELEVLLSVVVRVWNAALMPTNKRDLELSKLLRNFPPGLDPHPEELVRSLLLRKQHDFGQFDRPVIDFKVTDTADGPHISVISLLNNPSR